MSFGLRGGLNMVNGERSSVPGAVVFDLEPPIERGEIRALCRRARTMLQDSGATLLVCDVGAFQAPDAVVLDALARLQLTAKRIGGEVRVRHACEQLQGLLALSGLAQVIRTCRDSGVEAGRHPE